MTEPGPRPNCDVCGEPILPGQIIYTVANKWDDNDRWVSGRHGKCQNQRDAEIRQNMQNSVRRLRGLVGELRGKVR